MASMLGGSGASRVAEFIANPRKAVWKLSVPVMAGMAIQTLYNIVDMVFVGRLGGDAVAALTFNMPIVFFAMGITFGLGTGATAVIARFMGADDKKSADNAAEHAVLIGLGVGVLVVACSLVFKTQLFALLGAEDIVLSLAIQYFEIVVLGFLFQILSSTFRSIMSGEGDTRTPLMLIGSGTLINIALDPIFIFSLDMGVPGAAVATVVSQGLVFVAFIGYIFVRKGTYVEFRFGDFTPSRRIAGEILRIGLPASASMIIMSVGGMFYNRIVSAFGWQAVAALGIGGRMDAVPGGGAGRSDSRHRDLHHPASRDLCRGPRCFVLDFLTAAGGVVHGGSCDHRHCRRVCADYFLRFSLHHDRPCQWARVSGIGQWYAGIGAHFTAYNSDFSSPGVGPDAGLRLRPESGVDFFRSVGPVHVHPRCRLDPCATEAGGG
jgi:hypothetical protein